MFIIVGAFVILFIYLFRWNNALLTWKRDRSQINISGVQWSLVANPTCLQPFGPQVTLSPERHWCARGPLPCVPQQNKGTGALLEPEAGKDILKQGEKLGTACRNSLSLGKEVFQAQGPFLCGWVGLWNTARIWLPLPTILYWNSLIKCLSSQWTLRSSKAVTRSVLTVQ